MHQPNTFQNHWSHFNSSSVDRGDTIDHRYYIDNCVELLFEEIRTQRLTSDTHTIKHHNNAGPHMHKGIVNYLESEGITIIRQPVNSPDLAPCDFWLFTLIKQNLSNPDDSIPYQSQKSYIRWIKRTIKILSING